MSRFKVFLIEPDNVAVYNWTDSTNRNIIYNAGNLKPLKNPKITNYTVVNGEVVSDFGVNPVLLAFQTEDGKKRYEIIYAPLDSPFVYTSDGKPADHKNQTPTNYTYLLMPKYEPRTLGENLETVPLEQHNKESIEEYIKLSYNLKPQSTSLTYKQYLAQKSSPILPSSPSTPDKSPTPTPGTPWLDEYSFENVLSTQEELKEKLSNISNEMANVASLKKQMLDLSKEVLNIGVLKDQTSVLSKEVSLIANLREKLAVCEDKILELSNLKIGLTDVQTKIKESSDQSKSDLANNKIVELTKKNEDLSLQLNFCVEKIQELEKKDQESKYLMEALIRRLYQIYPPCPIPPDMKVEGGPVSYTKWDLIKEKVESNQVTCSVPPMIQPFVGSHRNNTRLVLFEDPQEGKRELAICDWDPEKKIPGPPRK